MNYTQLSSFNELINSYKDLFSDLRSEKNVNEGKKREVKNAKSLIERKTSQMGQLESRVDTIESSLESSSASFFSTIDSERRAKINEFFNLKKRLANLHWEREKLYQQSNISPDVTLPMTSSQSQRIQSLINSINSAVNQLETSLYQAFDETEYDVVTVFNKPTLESNHDEIVNYYNDHLKLNWMSIKDKLVELGNEMSTRVGGTFGSIGSKRLLILNMLGDFEIAKDNLATAIQNNEPESAIESYELAIENIKNTLKGHLQEIAFLQTQFNAIHIEYEVSFRILADRLEESRYEAKNYYNEFKIVLKASNVKHPESEFQWRITDIVNPIKNMILNVTQQTLNETNANGVAPYFVGTLGLAFDRLSDRLTQSDYLRDEMDNSEVFLDVAKDPLYKLTTTDDGKRVINPLTQGSISSEVLNYYNDLSVSTDDIISYKVLYDKSVDQFNGAWNSFTSGAWHTDVDALIQSRNELERYRLFNEKEYTRLNHGHYGITEAEFNQWNLNWDMKTYAEVAVYSAEKALSRAMNKKSKYQSIFEGPWDTLEGLKSTLDSAESTYNDLTTQYNVLNGSVGDAIDILAAMPEFQIGSDGNPVSTGEESQDYLDAFAAWASADAALSSFKDDTYIPAQQAKIAAQSAFDEVFYKSYNFYSASMSGADFNDVINGIEYAQEMLNTKNEEFQAAQQVFDEYQGTLEYVNASEADKLTWLKSERSTFAGTVINLRSAIESVINTLNYVSGDSHLLGYAQTLKGNFNAVIGVDAPHTDDFESTIDTMMVEVKEWILSPSNPRMSHELSKSTKYDKWAKLQQSSPFDTILESSNHLEFFTNILHPANEGYLTQNHLNGMGIEPIQFIKQRLFENMNGTSIKNALDNYLDNGGEITSGLV